MDLAADLASRPDLRRLKRLFLDLGDGPARVAHENDEHGLLFINKTGRDAGIRVEAGVIAGPRAGLSWVSGEIPAGLVVEQDTEVRGQHLRMGLVAGLRAGFRHVHVALELGGDWHHVSGRLGGASVAFDQLSLTPAGGLVLSF